MNKAQAETSLEALRACWTIVSAQQRDVGEFRYVSPLLSEDDLGMFLCVFVADE